MKLNTDYFRDFLLVWRQQLHRVGGVIQPVQTSPIQVTQDDWSL